MRERLAKKYDGLISILKDAGSLVVAFSGGVDSTLLLKAARDILGEKVLAVTATSGTYTREELEEARNTARSLGADHVVIETNEFEDENFVTNPKDRCYYCKRELFSKLSDIARKRGLKSVADGSNADDASDFRPGRKAKEEFGVISPLAKAGLSKDDVREISRELGLPTWDRPSLACLASRLPYGTRITRERLEKIGKAEAFVRELGFREVRVRDHGSIARIELGRDEIPGVLRDNMMERITGKLESLGFAYAAVDLKGYRSGSMNEILEEIA